MLRSGVVARFFYWLLGTVALVLSMFNELPKADAVVILAYLTLCAVTVARRD